MTDDEEFSTSGLGTELLSAGRDEWPSDEALSRTLVAVGAGAAVAVVAGGAAASVSASTVVKGGATLVTFGSVMKWLGMGALSGVVVAGVAHQVTVPSNAKPAPAVSVAPPRVASPGAPKLRALAKSEPVVAAPEPEASLPKLSPAAAQPAPEPKRAVDEQRVPLAAEVALVDRARAALASGNPARALDELAGYETAFADPRLQPEVLFLRMEAHLATGNIARAKATAEQTLRYFPRGPHAARARAVIEGQR